MPLSKTEEKKLKALGARVKKLRLLKNLTQKDLAYSIGKDYQSIYRLESGGINPSYIYLQEICKGLDTDISELLKDL